ncbi:MAG: tRNA pseudouridine(38-40) synthase TruA [Chloroflexi bacterium]|nr:tRNA pseudouridine(38-40) synthase TruA [Chloroflexota bacterium]
MSRLLAIVEFDGTDFHGFQIQQGRRTVQGELELALYRITGVRVRVIGAGRTDTGVHAAGMGAHFDTGWERGKEVLLRAMNAVLPPDVALRALRTVPPTFSARFDAHSRSYRYTILNHPVRSPLAERYALRVPEPLDVGAMDTATSLLIGRHDFGPFGRPPYGNNAVREMHRARAQRSGDRITIDLEANAFLYRMVRRIVGTLIAVGNGALSVAEFGQVLEDKRRARDSVPPHGLCLTAINYDLQDESERRSER